MTGSGTYLDRVAGNDLLRNLATTFSPALGLQGIGTRADGYLDPSFHPPLGLLTSTLAPGTHLLGLPNGNFEDGLPGWGTAKGVSSGSQASTATIQIDGSTSITGLNSVKMTLAADTDAAGLTYGSVPCGEGIPVNILVRAKSASVKARLAIFVYWFDATQKAVSTPSSLLFNTVGIATTFTEYGGQVTPPSGTRYARFQIYIDTAADTIWVDQVRFEVSMW